ncbi:MAG: hypothetical protein ABIL23_01460, partial [candidate division WOR-3 bacterium]
INIRMGQIFSYWKKFKMSFMLIRYSFCTKLIDAVLESLNKSLKAIETERLVISSLKKQLMEIKSHE